MDKRCMLLYDENPLLVGVGFTSHRICSCHFIITTTSVRLVSIAPETSKTLREFTDATVEEASMFTIGGIVEQLLSGDNNA